MGFLDNIAEKEYERQRMGEGIEGWDPLDKKNTVKMNAAPLAFSVGGLGGGATLTGASVFGVVRAARSGASAKDIGRAVGLGIINTFTFGGLSRRAKDMKALEEADIAAGERIKSLEEFQRELQRTLQQGAEIQQERMTFI